MPRPGDNGDPYNPASAAYVGSAHEEAEAREDYESSHCPGCGSDSVIYLTPVVAGPDGWGAKCKACGHRWDR